MYQFLCFNFSIQFFIHGSNYNCYNFSYILEATKLLSTNNNQNTLVTQSINVGDNSIMNRLNMLMNKAK